MSTDPVQSGTQAARARQQGLGAARGLITGIIFTLGLWMALMGLVFLIVR